MIPYAMQLQASSEAFQQSMETLQTRGVAYHEDPAYIAARQAIENFTPDLLGMSGERVQLEADLGVAIDEQTSRKYGGLAVSAILRGVQIQELHEVVEDGNYSLELVRYDLCALLSPRFVEPDPVDLLFSGELYVPFSSVTLLEPAA